MLTALGIHAFVMQRFDKARMYLEKANSQTRGRDPMMLNNLAVAIIGSGRSKDQALQLANKTLALLPDHSDALATRGEIYIVMERWSDAIADLKESASLRNNNAAVHRLLERAYTGLPDFPNGGRTSPTGGSTGRAAGALMTDRRAKSFPVLTYANV